LTLHTRAGFEKFCGSLPAVTFVEQWGSSVAKVGGKVFAMYGLAEHDVVFKVTDTSFEGLTSLAGIGQAPYTAKRQWVAVQKGADLPLSDLKAYIRAAHRIIAGKLTRKLQAELGLTEIVSGERKG
jgi:predicted DNA-binding protein (MmcQ/YjbR family)